MEQPPEAFNEAELYAMIDAQPAAQAAEERFDTAYQQAYDTVWSAIESIDNLSLAVGRGDEACTAVALRLRDHYLASIHTIEGTPDNAAIRNAQSETALQMAAVRLSEDLEVVAALITLRTDCSLNASNSDETKRRLIAERYASRDDAQQLVQSLMADPQYTPSPDIDADQWIAIINQAFDGEGFDYRDPDDLILVLDALYEPAEDESSPRMRLFNDLVDYLEDSTDTLTKTNDHLGGVIIQTLASELLQIACQYDTDTSLARQDELIDDTLRSMPNLSILSAPVKAIITPYRGQLSSNSN